MLSSIRKSLHVFLIKKYKLSIHLFFYLCACFFNQKIKMHPSSSVFFSGQTISDLDIYQNQMSKNQAVKVGIRIRPLNKRELDMNSPICVDNQDNVLSIKKDKDAKQFVFDYVFGIETRQENIYETCAYSLVENSLDGYNGTVFAYGQTGAGKTFTMVGDYKDPEIKGIIPRTFDHIISAIQTTDSRQYVIRASFIEIYNEDIMDLLEKKGKDPNKKELKENPQQGVFIKDLKKIPVKSVEELFGILDFGNKNRTVHATAMNATSSRSHALFTIHIQSLEGKDKVKASKINLVDLAGSERQSKTEASGDRLKEGAKINLSLTALGNVINALVDGKKGGHIPYRDSKLTRLLQDSLGGNTKTLMIASVSPAADNYDETISTLRYAARARNIKNTPKVNEDPKDAMIREYLAEIQQLKKQLQSQGGGTYVPEEQTEMIQGQSEMIKQAQEKVEEKQKQLDAKEQQILQMQEKLREMQELVLKKEQNHPEIEKTRRMKKKKIQKQEELMQKRLQQIQKEDEQLMDQEKQEIEEEKEGSLLGKFEYWKKIASKLRKKFKAAISDKEDLQKEFQTEREDLNITIRNLEGDLSFYTQLVKKFISEEQIATLKENSSYDEERRQYTLPPFLMHEDSITLPKTLKKHQVDDLWKEKRSKVKMELLSVEMPSIEKKIKEIPSKFAEFTQTTGSPFLQMRKMFKLPDFNDPKYQEKQIDLGGKDHLFRRTNYRINDNRSRSRSRSGSNAKLQPIYNRPTSKEGINRPTSRSRGKQKLQPIRK